MARLAFKRHAGSSHKLGRWIAARRDTGAVAALPESARAGLSRDAQYAKLESFLGRLVPPHG